MLRGLHWLLLTLLITAPLEFALVFADGPPPVPSTGAKRPRVNRFEVVGKLYRHTDAVIAAAADMSVLSSIKGPEELRYYRYLTVHNLPPPMRLEGIKLSSMVINSLSRSDDIVVPAIGGPDNILIRLNLFDYGIDPKVWDKFGEKDPYFHQHIKQQATVTHILNETQWVKTGEPYQKADGKWYYKLVEKPVATTVVEPGPVTTSLAAAAWCDANSMSLLIAKTQSTAPILRADWFITFATLSPQYYDFLGFKKLDDYLDFVAFDKRAIKREARATVVTSGANGHCPRVSQNNRILRWLPTFNGGVWETFDYTASVGAKNVINNFLNNKRDAGEYIGNGGNGLQYYFLVNDKNERLDKGDSEIVVDTMAYDTIVRNGRSCIWCHTKGINSFDSQFQLQVGPKPDQSDLGLSGKDGRKMSPKDAIELQQFIRKVFGTPNFTDIVGNGQKTYDAAIKLCNNLSAEENAVLFKKHWELYKEELIDTSRLSWEVGYTEEQIKAALPLRLDGRDDGVLLQQLLKPPISIRRDQFEEAFAGLMLRLLVVRDDRK